MAAGAGLGGRPALLTITAVEGVWSRLSEVELALYGSSGPLTSMILALLGWLVARRGAGRPGLGTLVGWLTFALNGWMSVGYLMVSPAFGFGDWMLLVDAFPNRGPTRISMVVTGLFVAGLLWKETVVSLSRLVGNGAGARRADRAVGITRTAWMSSGCIVATGAALGPVDAPTAALLALGTTMGTTWPMLIAARGVAELPVPGSPLDLSRSWPFLTLAATVAAAFVAGLGRGIDLAG